MSGTGGAEASVGSWEGLPEVWWGQPRGCRWLRASALAGDAVSRRPWETGSESLNGLREGTAANVAGPLHVASHPRHRPTSPASLPAEFPAVAPAPPARLPPHPLVSARGSLGPVPPERGGTLTARWQLVGYALASLSRRDRGVPARRDRLRSFPGHLSQEAPAAAAGACGPQGAESAAAAKGGPRGAAAEAVAAAHGAPRGAARDAGGAAAAGAARGQVVRAGAQRPRAFPPHALSTLPVIYSLPARAPRMGGPQVAPKEALDPAPVALNLFFIKPIGKRVWCLASAQWAHLAGVTPGQAARARPAAFPPLPTPTGTDPRWGKGCGRRGQRVAAVPRPHCVILPTPVVLSVVRMVWREGCPVPGLSPWNRSQPGVVNTPARVSWGTRRSVPLVTPPLGSTLKAAGDFPARDRPRPPGRTACLTRFLGNVAFPFWGRFG